MSVTNSSANMLLPIPAVGLELGPQYAIDINDCMTLIDAHDHTPGSGVQITPAGMNINIDLSMGGNNLTTIRSLRLSSQSSPLVGVLDINCVYDVLGDLYFTDGVGNQVRITQGGGVAGTPGSISGLVAPASASYVSANQTFVWQSDTLTPANMDAASYIFRNLSANSKGLTLSPPAAMGADYTLTLPALPAAATNKIVRLDSTGAFTASLTPDESTIKTVSNQLVAQSDALVDGVTLQSISNVMSVRRGDREHSWELNGPYSGLSFPLSNIDSIFFAPYNITITAVWIYNGTVGASGITEFDLKVASPSGSFTTILTTTGKIASTAASNIWTDSGSVVGAQTGVTKPVLLTTAISAGQAIRWDLITSMATPATDARIRIFYKQS